ncbi:sugar-binding transcriptional regulator [Bacillus salitolerans]|uniref:Sugar-binding transcriptional regulator n=1 Tax=Bacillus salitolerans TaxID=1437434 RepID=A0ABW4LW68_9BACI
MKSLVDIQKKLLPDLLSVMQKRYEILRHIRLTQPIGRRSLALTTNMTERVLRSEVDFLKSQNLLDMTTAGMSLTNEGHELLVELDDLMKEVTGLKVLEEKLQAKLQVKKVIVVSGDSDTSEYVKQEMGRAAVMYLKTCIQPSSVIAVTGGTTLASVASMMTPETKHSNLLFVPARGGLGEQVENQANTICAKMAEKAMGTYRLLHVPDEVSDEAYHSLVEEPAVREVLQLIRSASIVIHGIGDAKTMAERRKTKQETLAKIIDQKAVAEAFGYYFNKEGDVVHKVKTIGIQLDDLMNPMNVIAVAGGSSKAKAIQAFVKQGHDTVLITDEAVATELIKG